MAITKDLEESVSDSKLQTDSTAKKEFRTTSSVSLPKSEYAIVEQSQSNDQLKHFKSWVSNERWIELKKLADTAVKERKIFMIKGGGFPAVRRALLERGWVEKYEKARSPPTNIDPKNATGQELTKVERIILCKFIEHLTVDFLWTTKRDKYDWLLSHKDVILSRFCRSIFTTKEGLTNSLTQMHWHTEPGVSVTHFPRSYNIVNSESLEEFIEDFRITACISVLKWFTNMMQTVGENDLIEPHGKVPLTALEFAMTRLDEHNSFTTHKDIDDVEIPSHQVWDHEWDQFLTHHYLLVHENAKFIEEKGFNIRQLDKKAAKLLASISKIWPQIDIDGVFNIWIVKPGNKCRGKGIMLMNNMKDIVGLMNIPNAQKSRYVVQKYIENPLVIYNTKFDIRQWFLVTNCQPLTIWVYKDSYLRFSSQMFSLSNYHESVHLTNNAVQHKYKNNAERDKALPDENMWDCHTFQAYLRQIGKADMWDKKIYPEIKQCLVGAMLACQESMDQRQNSFELYGADFMLGEDFTPWLIEINSSPDLAPTTSVTARLCPQCLEDVVKVVLDRRVNPEASTGAFELVYKQVVPKAPAYLGLTLCINGKKLFKKVKDKKLDNRHLTPAPPRSNSPSSSTNIFIKDQPIPMEYQGPIITDFLSWLNPYDVFSNKDVEHGAKDTVRQAINVVKSDITVKSSKKKRKSSAPPFRAQRRRERNSDHKRRIVPHSCCQVEEQPNKQSGKYRTESAKNSSKTKFDRSVGNKRCYIDPDVWEQETTGILRSTISNQNKIAAKKQEQNAPVVRQTKSGVVSSKARLDVKDNTIDNSDAIKKITAVGKSICKLQAQNKIKQKSITFSKSCTSIYAPYRIVMTPLNDVDVAYGTRKKETKYSYML